jgi:hypothetical protein
MRRFWVCWAMMIVVPLWATTPAAAQFYQQRLQAAVAPPPIVNHLSLAPVPNTTFHAAPANSQPGPAAAGSGQPFASSEHQHRQHHHGISSTWLFWGTGYPLIWSPAYTPAFWPSDPAYFGFVPGDRFVPEPAPAARFGDRDREEPAAEPATRRRIRTSNADQKAKAGRFLGFGDGNFGKQKYLPAVERYKTAAQMAPDLAEPYFRQGYALVALGQYENAAKAFRRGLKIRSDWTGSPFRLDQIYGDGRLAKTQHLENLAKAVEANPLDANLLLTLGIQLFFDGQRARASVFFARAAQLGGNEDRLLNDFLPKPAPTGAAEQRGAAKIVF